jgi:phosphopentomutase
MNNFFVIVLDGVGIGELPDAKNYGDEGSDTLSHIAEAVNGLTLKNLEKLGLGNIKYIKGIKENKNHIASFGKMKEVSKGKDSTTGHWEISGLYVDVEFSYFPEGFPNEIIEKFKALTNCHGILGNKAASGTEIIMELGNKHIETGFPIIYTSADSVFQIAAHEKIIPLARLYEICEITRKEVLVPPVTIGRVIARPFIGENGNYIRTVNRKDFSLDPPSYTILDILKINNINTVSVGKVVDLFNYRGINIVIKTDSNKAGMKSLMRLTKEAQNSFIFANLVDFDVYFGHRNDPDGFAKALLDFDNFLIDFISSLDESDLLVITADHGNDPTTSSTDHSREYVPLLFYGKNIRSKDLGIRKTFSDIGKTVADFYKVENNLKGTSFLN